MKYKDLADIAVEAGRKTLPDFRSEIETELKYPYDLVTETDRKIEQFIIDEIRKKDPDAVFHGEEYGKSGDASGRFYIIDPVDGTANFVFGVPWYSVSIALTENGSITAGVVYNPVSADLYYADMETPAMLNGKRIQASEREKTDECLIIFGFTANRKSIARYIDDWGDLFDNARKGLPLLSPSLNLCLVAQGKADAFIDFGCSMFGQSAGAYILQKAGGRVRNYTDDDYDFRKTGIIALNRKLCI